MRLKQHFFGISFDVGLVVSYRSPCKVTKGCLHPTKSSSFRCQRFENKLRIFTTQTEYLTDAMCSWVGCTRICSPEGLDFNSPFAFDARFVFNAASDWSKMLQSRFSRYELPAKNYSVLWRSVRRCSVKKTNNGKIDRRRLLKPSSEHRNASTENIKARRPTIPFKGWTAVLLLSFKMEITTCASLCSF